MDNSGSRREGDKTHPKTTQQKQPKLEKRKRKEEEE
jgi:hypothetical protein